jgi:hypothetical protein
MIVIGSPAHAAAPAEHDHVDRGRLVEIERQPSDAKLGEELRHRQLDQGIADVSLRPQIADAAAKERLHHAVKSLRLQERSTGCGPTTGSRGDAERRDRLLRSEPLVETRVCKAAIIAERSVFFLCSAMLHGGSIGHKADDPWP